MAFSENAARDALGSFREKAEEFLSNSGKLEAFLQKLEGMLERIPLIGDTLAQVMVLISLLRSYLTKEYTGASQKTLILALCALLYLVKGDDLINDRSGILGYADDYAVIALACKWMGEELTAFKNWRSASSVYGN